MKKSLLIAALAVFGMTRANAQNVTFGVKAGLNISNLRNYTIIFEQKLEAKVGLQVGGLAEYRFANNWLSIQAEALFSQQGAKEGLRVYDRDHSEG